MAAGSDRFRGFGFIVPTRNRSEMAIRSIGSILEGGRSDVQVIVSDNCTEPQESETLRRFCEPLNRRGITYLKPDSPLSMPLHYEWVLERAGELLDVNHFGFLTDRFLLRKGAVDDLCQIASVFPDHAIAYRFDSVWDHRLPCQVALSTWSGHAYKCPTINILSSNSQMSSFEFVPVLLNSVINRRILADLRRTFGDCCQSIAPDFGCGFRTLAIEDEIVFLDKSLSFNWGRGRSNGFSFSRGVLTKDAKSFIAGLGGQVLYHATPIPEITVVANAVIHEYLAVRDRIGGPKFPPLDHQAYVTSLAREIEFLENEDLKSHFQELLHAYDPAVTPAPPEPAEWDSRVFDYRAMKPKDRIKTLIVNEATRPLWWALYRHLGVTLPNRHRVNFPNQEQAFYYAWKNLGPKTNETGRMPSWCVEVA